MAKNYDSDSEISTVSNIEKKLEFFTKKTVITLAIICGIGLFLRIFYFPFDIPISLDATGYFWYAIDTNVLGHFPTHYKFPNTGWPTLLSAIFTVFRFTDFLDYMTLQRLVSVSISVITTIPVYFLCRRFFGKSLSLVGVSLFAFEPRIIQNSLLGIADPLYILLVITSFSLLVSGSKKLVYVSFGVAALSALVRYEGMLYLVVLSIMFFVLFRTEKRAIIKFAIAISIYVLVLTPIIYLRIQSTGDDGLTSHIIAGATAPGIITAGEDNKEVALFLFVANGFANLFKYLGWVMIPYFVIFVPIGVILGFKKRNSHYFGIILSIIVLAIPALYAYAREIQETRYLLVLIPFFSILSLFMIDSITSKTSRRKLFFILLIVSIFASSWMFLEFKKIDLEHEREAFAIARHVTEFTKITNVYYPESKYLKVATIGNNFPILSSSTTPPTVTLSTDYTSIADFVKSNKDVGLTHIIVDDNKNRPNFLKDLFSHEEKYPYLVKVFDSLDHGFKYHVKIYKIDYEKFSQSETNTSKFPF